MSSALFTLSPPLYTIPPITNTLRFDSINTTHPNYAFAVLKNVEMGAEMVVEGGGGVGEAGGRLN